ncbi:hypothetical protein Pan241w_60900 [Gimesia alba]|uniref:Uncharacterized protein n=1 Tax=Gimesia alba TaxID=2527973 RepID=A0A517RQ25_9PLAN|nr:hypothetical protein Pan241w_60900 [Gimesia alba]
MSISQLVVMNHEIGFGIDYFYLHRKEISL